jgi:hypothetical protein
LHIDGLFKVKAGFGNAFRRRKITKDLYERNYQTAKSLLMFSTKVLITTSYKIYLPDFNKFFHHSGT